MTKTDNLLELGSPFHFLPFFLKKKVKPVHVAHILLETESKQISLCFCKSYK